MGRFGDNGCRQRFHATPTVDKPYAAAVAEKTATKTAQAKAMDAKIDVIRMTGAKNAARVVKMGQIEQIEALVDKDRRIVRRFSKLDLPPETLAAYAEELRKQEEDAWFAALNAEKRERESA